MRLEHSGDGIWMPVRTKPRQEKKLKEYCDAHGIPCYLPLQKRMHRYNRRCVEFFIPMFSGYVFCQVNDARFSQMVCSNAVLFKIDVDEFDEGNLLDELNSIRRLELLSSEQEVVVKPELVPGVPVMIKHGPLQGMSGIVSARNKKTILSVNIEMLGQSVSAEVDIEFLEKSTD
jgi:transcription antitermination factor NusG